MSQSQNTPDPLKDFTDEQLADLIKSNDDLDQVEAGIIQEDKEYEEKKLIEKDRKFIQFRRLRKSPIEIINRILFLFFLISFILSFWLVYSLNSLWFLVYLISAFSCILYTPNRKAIKELIAAWPNIVDLINKKNLWR